MNFFRFRAFVKRQLLQGLLRASLGIASGGLTFEFAMSCPFRPEPGPAIRVLLFDPTISLTLRTPVCQSQLIPEEGNLATTLPAAPSARPFLHVRGSWPAREDRIPSAVWLRLVCLGMVAAFG